MEMSRAFLVTLSFRQDETYLLNSGLFKLPPKNSREPHTFCRGMNHNGNPT